MPRPICTSTPKTIAIFASAMTVTRFVAPGPLVATYTFVNPIVAVILGWRFLDERPTPQMLVGTVLVVGSVVAVWRLNNRPPRQAR